MIIVYIDLVFDRQGNINWLLGLKLINLQLLRVRIWIYDQENYCRNENFALDVKYDINGDYFYGCL